jgi:hypothetical protein
MGKYTNTTGVSLPLATWLATDNYDGKSSAPNPYFVSATSLLKSPRQIVLGMRAKPEDESIDVASIIKSRIGNAIHDSIEAAWSTPSRVVKTLESLGYPKSLAERVRVNPDTQSNYVYPVDMIPVYMEQREYKKLGKWTLTGKFDFILDGHLHDFKSTGTFTFVNKTKDDDYIKQGSIYRWLNPTKITDDVMSIDFIFMDWKQASVMQAGYPPSQTVKQDYPLMSFNETENWLKDRLSLIETLELTSEDQLPLCTDSELWRREAQWKYYKSGVVGTRSTRNFDNAAEAYQKQQDDGGMGLVLEIQGAPTACLYCNVSALCTQKDAYIDAGELVL